MRSPSPTPHSPLFADLLQLLNLSLLTGVFANSLLIASIVPFDDPQLTSRYLRNAADEKSRRRLRKRLGQRQRWLRFFFQQRRRV